MKETPTKVTTVRCFTGALALSVITLASIIFAPRPSLAECPETGCNKAPPLLFELEQPTVYPVSSNQKHLCFPDMPAQVSLVRVELADAPTLKKTLVEGRSYFLELSAGRRYEKVSFPTMENAAREGVDTKKALHTPGSRLYELERFEIHDLEATSFHGCIDLPRELEAGEEYAFIDHVEHAREDPRLFTTRIRVDDLGVSAEAPELEALALEAQTICEPCDGYAYYKIAPALRPGSNQAIAYYTWDTRDEDGKKVQDGTGLSPFIFGMGTRQIGLSADLFETLDPPRDRRRTFYQGGERYELRLVAVGENGEISNQLTTDFVFEPTVKWIPNDDTYTLVLVLLGVGIFFGVRAYKGLESL